MPDTIEPATADMLRMLAARLERLSADSLWARRASGARRSLLKSLELLESGETISTERADQLIRSALELLTRAAQEIPESPAPSKRPLGKSQKPRIL